MARKNQSITLDVSTLANRKLGKYGLTRAHLSRLGPRVKKIITRVERERGDGGHRYRELPHDRLMRQAVEEFAKALRPTTQNLVVLGIGGSALGASALHEALNHPQHNLMSRRKRGGPRLFVMDNIDPAHFAGMLDVAKDDLPGTLFNIVTKSGETTECLSQFLVIRNLLTRRLGREEAKKRIVVTTDSRSGTMRSIADREGFASLPVPEGVGGRFSVLSAVGLFPAAMCGIDITSMLKGAAEMDDLARSTVLQRNPAALFAAVNYLYYKKGVDISVMMPYSNALTGLADWFLQLWAESLGKAHNESGSKVVHVGPTPIRALGATDQHSQLQLYREGPNNKLITFLEVGQFDKDIAIPSAYRDQPALAYLGGGSMGKLLNTEKQATEQALLTSNRPCLTIRFPSVSPFAVGQFISMLQVATTIAAGLFGVNPYDQPGVELGKQITYHLLGREGYEKIR
jgi:glucose-6-phosphate isomerase